MQSATFPQNEIQRIQALNDTNLLDTPPEQLFDSLTESLAQLFSMPVSLVCLVDSERVWLKSSCGIDGVSEIQRDIGFCPHTITQTDIFEIKDASVDKRFHDSPVVANAPYLRYYAGAPLITSDGYALGTLCVMDYQPRELSESQKIQLKNMASTVTALIEARRQQNIQELSKEFKLGAVVEISPIETFLVDKSSGKILYANRAALLNLGISLNKAKDLRWDELLVYIPQKLIDSHLNSTASYFSKSISFQSEHKRGDGSTYPVSVQIKPVGSSTSEFLILSSDTSKQVEAKNRETSLKNKIAHMDRINTANTLSSGLAHELNQPLTAITQYCNTASSIIEKNSLENDPILHDAIQKATSQAHRAAEIIKRYRAFTQKHIPSRSIVNIAQLIQESTSLLRHNLSKNNIELTTSIDDVPLINADHIHLSHRNKEFKI